MSRFSLGQTSVTERAAAALAAHGLSPDSFFARHAAGDWGEGVGEDDRTGNAFALEHGVTRFAITSVYRLPDGAELLVMTEPSRTRTGMCLDDELVDRPVTAREGYALWAGHYDREVNALVAIETPYVEAILSELAVTTALDAAAGTGRHALRLARRGVQVTALDQSPEMLAVARAHAAREALPIGFHEGDLGDPLPFGDASFDLVISALALCHIPQLAEAVREFARVVKPGGTVLVTDWHPYCPSQGWVGVLFAPGEVLVLPYARHSRDDYVQAFEQAGLLVTQTVDALLGEAPEGTLPEAERTWGKDIPFCLVVRGMRPVAPGVRMGL